MKRNQRRQRKNFEPSISNGIDVSVGDVRNTTRSKEQMKLDWGSLRTTMKRKLGK